MARSGIGPPGAWHGEEDQAALCGVWGSLLGQGRVSKCRNSEPDIRRDCCRKGGVRRGVREERERLLFSYDFPVFLIIKNNTVQ